MLDHPDKFRGIHRIASARMPGFDYGSNGHYFVTICTASHRQHFGRIAAGKMELSVAGKIVASEWLKTPKMRANIQLDEWVIMPNHMHGIVVIDSKVETHCNASLQVADRSCKLSDVIRGFKAASTKAIHMSGFEDFAWQARFYDHVIRREESLDRIREYIRNNPANWDKDKYYGK